MIAAELVGSFAPTDFIGLSVHERVLRITNRWANSGFRITRLTFPPGLFSSIERVPYPLLTGCDSGLALMLLGEKVPIFARFDGGYFVQVEFAPHAGGDERMAFEIDINPPRVQ